MSALMVAATEATSLILTIEPPKIVDLIISKQTQYYTLWGVYTAVQFTAGSYGYGHKVPLGGGLAVVFCVGAVNFWHLRFVLQCVSQLDKLKSVLRAALNDPPPYETTLPPALHHTPEGI